MSEPIRKPMKNTESYRPKKPEIVNLMDEAQHSATRQANPEERVDAMKKIIENMTFSTGWEYWFFPSCFASVYMRIEGLTADRQDIITLFSAVSGISHVQLDLTNEAHFVPGVGYNETKVIDEYDDYIKFTMSFAGYAYERHERDADKAAVFAGIKKSIDAGRPVLMNFGAEYSWCVITGYDEQGETLYGLDNAGAGGSYWKDKPGTYEDDLFATDRWFEHMTEAVIVTGKSSSAATCDDVFRRMINIMEAMEKLGYVKHSADYLTDDVNFEGYDDEKFLALTGRIHTLIALLIDQRAWMSVFFANMAKVETSKDRAQYFTRIAEVYEGSKDVCWIAWNMVGAEGFFRNTPGMKQEDCAKLLPAPVYRRTIADILKIVLGNDRIILGCLKKIMEK